MHVQLTTKVYGITIKQYSSTVSRDQGYSSIHHQKCCLWKLSYKHLTRRKPPYEIVIKSLIDGWIFWITKTKFGLHHSLTYLLTTVSSLRPMNLYFLLPSIKFFFFMAIPYQGINCLYSNTFPYLDTTA